ncbi:hypothetical protein TCAL_14205 [Tigriopus californicus]|uniref:E3 ubiquitin-protein ligase E3D n=1 Tax=Tigriopus californicus TaxID=6832 RepID=A0A553NSS0_TIGCA|nr:uncharacterized protein LOC131886271 [Tigriopus californicus]TRY68460.1 hypothetical protein TCAL_14205 [Tigriopus californicus]
MLLSLEFRPRLSVVNGVFRHLDQFDRILMESRVGSGPSCGSSSLALIFEDDVLSLKCRSSNEAYVRVVWPKSMPMPTPQVEIRFHLVPEHREVIFRAQLGALGPELMSNAMSGTSLPQSWSLALPAPKCLHRSKATEACPDLRLCCTNCDSSLGQNLKFEAIHPLPSIAWREFSQDWFCCCTSSCDPQRCPTPPGPSELSNGTMSSQTLAPRLNTLLFAPGFILVHPETITPGQVEKCPDWNNLYCVECDAGLGYRDDQHYQLWQHAVILTDTDTPIRSHLTPTDSVVDMIHGALSEAPELAPKIELTSAKSTLSLWIMERNTHFYTHQKDEHTSSNGNRLLRPTERSFMKILFKKTSAVHSNDFNTESISVNDDMIEAGIAFLRKGQAFLSANQTRDGPWEISVMEHNPTS